MVKIHFLGRKIAKRRFQPFGISPVVLGIVRRFRLLAVPGNNRWKLSSFALRIEQRIF